MSGKDLAAVLGWYPSRVSKLENGRQAPTITDVEAWTRACGVDADTAQALHQMVTDAESVYQEWRRWMRDAGQVAVQASYNELVAHSTVIRFFDTVWVPGLLQTPQYAKYPISEGVDLHGADPTEVDAAVATRMQRQHVLYQPDRRFEFVLWEPVLGALVGGCPPEVMIGQLDRLLVSMELPNVRLGIIPLRVPTPTTPQNSFQIYDSTVIVETFLGESTFAGNTAIKYGVVMDSLWDEAVEGRDARALVLDAAQALRKGRGQEPGADR